MKKALILLNIIALSITLCKAQQRHTKLSINGEKFLINGVYTYKDRTWKGNTIEGLLMNSRMVQGIFDDLNEQTKDTFKYPDTGVWDAERNTNEFVAAMKEWQRYGLLAFTLNLQGGSPTGYGNKGWINSAFDPKGELRKDYLARLEKILDKADELGMVVILGYFYFGQDEHLENEAAVISAVDNITNWLLDKKYTNVIVEIANECDIHYNHEIIKPHRVSELIERVRKNRRNGHQLLVGTSYSGGKIPSSEVVKNADFILLHGNGVTAEQITTMVKQTRQLDGYTPKPILFNEDDHFDFDKDTNNFVNAIKEYASWGYFDYRKEGEDFVNGFQSVPVDWGINAQRKNDFFNKLKEITMN